MENESWCLLLSSDQLYEIEFTKGYLSENDIDSVIVNKKDSLYLFGEYELYVSKDNLLKAKYLVSKINEK
jgi:hypothetical protein